MEVVVQRRETYGTVRYYPENDKAVIFAAILGKKTIDYTTLMLIKDLGFKVVMKGNQEVVL